MQTIFKNHIVVYQVCALPEEAVPVVDTWKFQGSFKNYNKESAKLFQVMTKGECLYEAQVEKVLLLVCSLAYVVYFL